MALQVTCRLRLFYASSLHLISKTSLPAHAGATADAFTLYDRLETQLEQHSGVKHGSVMCFNRCSELCQSSRASSHVAGQLTRAAVELAKLWRNDKYLRKLDVRQRMDCNAGKCFAKIHLRPFET